MKLCDARAAARAFRFGITGVHSVRDRTLEPQDLHDPLDNGRSCASTLYLVRGDPVLGAALLRLRLGRTLREVALWRRCRPKNRHQRTQHRQSQNHPAHRRLVQDVVDR